jgi:hypothetical protein
VIPGGGVSDPAVSQLVEWGNFYVIIGSAAAGLTGLMFVVITLGAEAQTITNEKGLRAFVTPTVVHFCIALIVAVYLSSPGQTPASIGAGCAILGLAGLLYVGGAMVIAGGLREYQPVREDWIWHGAFPIIAYIGFLIVAVVVCTGHVSGGLRFLAADTVFILLTAIHNAWDAAVWVAMSASRRQPDKSSEATDSDTTDSDTTDSDTTGTA